MQLLDKKRLQVLMKAAHRFAMVFGQQGPFDPEDIAQAAMLRVLAKNDGRAPSFRWLRKVVRSVAYDTGRQHARELRCLQIQSLEVLERDDVQKCACQDHSELLISEAVVSQLGRVMNQLTPAHRTSLLLQAEGASYERIAQLTGSKVGTVRSRIHYARMKARELLKEAV